MFSPNKKLDPPKDYEFPFTPYNIQQQLMDAVYKTLTQKSIGIFESPTGTGKSLTLTCSVLRWIEDRERLEREELSKSISKMMLEVRDMTRKIDAAQDWITASYAATEKKKKLDDLNRLQKLRQLYDEKLNEMRESQRDTHKHLQNGVGMAATTSDSFVDKPPDFLDWDEQIVEAEQENVEEEKYQPIQVFFCSRTHSQLAQVVREVKRTAYGKKIRCVSLASRQQLCINPLLRKLPNVNIINERCLDMASKSKEGQDNTKTQCCAFRKPNLVQHLSATILFNLMDIEDMVGEGEALRACPYYAAREAAKSAQLVMLTYQMLLHRRTRLQTGIDLHGSIVIVDEAHNLLDTIARLHSCELNLQQLLLVQEQISAYKMRYLKRFSSTSLLNINQLIFITKRLIKLLRTNISEAPKSNTVPSRVLRTYELTAEAEFFNINLHVLLKFCEGSRLAQKLQGFTDKIEQPDMKKEIINDGSATTQLLKQIKGTQKKVKTQPANVDIYGGNTKQHIDTEKTISINGAFRSLMAFIESLTENAEDGRIIICTDAGGMYKYILLNPGDHFADIVREARSIIVAGGTMQPTRELTEQLFRTCPHRIQEYFYGHVVPPDAVLPFVVAQGPTGRRLCFNYIERSTPNMLSELGMIVQNVCNVVPAGIVCFLPSYEYLDLMYTHLCKSGTLERISLKKRIFSETRTGSSAGVSVEKLLNDYSDAIKRDGSGGALLFSVVGGKLSEGLNFADDLGRCVIVVGMPYPNRQSVELQERMRYLDETLEPGSGNEYYENLCLKAINQCIGRSVRHINDYACVLLVDERYCKETVQSKLPQWITRSLQIPKTFGALQATTARFFKQMKIRK